MTRRGLAILLALSLLLLGGLAAGVSAAQLPALAPAGSRAPAAAELEATVAAQSSASLEITHGIASGDVTATSVVVWARASGPAHLHAEYDLDPLFRSPRAGPVVSATAATDYTATAKLDGLVPNTTYVYRLWFTSAEWPGGPAISPMLAGVFRTPPPSDVRRAVSFVFSGDLGGSGYCRALDRGYAIFTHMQMLAPDFFIASGDMIYADHGCPASGRDGRQNVPSVAPAVNAASIDWTDLRALREVYWQHWRYNRADPHFQAFLARVPVYAQWDDHEVINDFGADWTYWNARNRTRAGFPNLVMAGRDALFQYNPMDRHPPEPDRLYRQVNWGRDIDLFLLDARSYRSRNDLPDTPANAKTLLGAAQLEWLKDGLRRSTATWKIVSAGVPLSILTGNDEFGRDSWSRGTPPNPQAPTGFRRELSDLLRALDDAQVPNMVWLATDVHFAATLRYQLDPNGDGRPLIFHELVAGPLSANPGPGPVPERLDRFLNPTVLYGEGNLFNFAHVRVEEQADGLIHLIAEVWGEDGEPRPGSRLDLVPR